MSSVFYHKGSSGKSNINAITAKTGTIKMESGIVDVNQYKGKLDAKLFLQVKWIFKWQN